MRPCSDSPLLKDVVPKDNVHLMLDSYKSYGDMDDLEAVEVQFNYKTIHMVRGFQKIDHDCTKELALCPLCIRERVKTSYIR